MANLVVTKTELVAGAMKPAINMRRMQQSLKKAEAHFTEKGWSTL